MRSERAHVAPTPEGMGAFVALVRSTLRGLLAPRRAIPISLVVVPLLVIQDAYSRDAFAVPLALAMCGSFLLVGPLLWRWLFPMNEKRGEPLARAFVYASVGAVVVVGIGRVLPQLVHARPTFLTSTPSLGVSVALFWVGGWGLARDIELEEHLAHERARAEALAREAEHAQLLALKSHLDPHFLFNTLNAIAEWCREDGKVAEKAILQLSSMLRTMMTGIQSTTWPLAREIELVDALLALHAVRDPTTFSVRRELPDPVPDVEVPPMLLLPIAENAMKHGPLAGHRGEVRFAIRCEPTPSGTRLVVVLENPGPYRGPREGSSGLPIVQKRLALAFGDGASFVIEAAPGRGAEPRTRATLSVTLAASLPRAS